VSEFWRHTGRAPGHVRRSALRRIFYAQPYRNLMKEVARRRPATFETVWDVDDSVALSRDLYDEVEMYGQRRYRYRPRVRALDAAVWSGLAYQSLLLPETPAIVAAVNRCDVVQKVVFETDEHGFKLGGFPVSGEGPSVLFVGDSFTEGLHVSGEDTFADAFGRLARAAGLRVTPVNAGVNGYGALEECWTVESWAPRLGTVLVVASLFPNDVAADDVMDVVEGRVPEARYDELFRWLDRMRRFCHEQKIVLAVAAIPVAPQLATKDRGAFEEHVETWCRREGVPFLDPLDTFRPLGQRALYFGWDPHLHAGGHATYARFLFDRLRPTLARLLVPHRGS
jgi:hypothetical protein